MTAPFLTILSARERDPARMKAATRARVAAALGQVGRADLAALYQHCDRYFPNLEIPAGHAVHIPRTTYETGSAIGSPSAMIAEGTTGAVCARGRGR